MKPKGKLLERRSDALLSNPVLKGFHLFAQLPFICQHFHAWSCNYLWKTSQAVKPPKTSLQRHGLLSTSCCMTQPGSPLCSSSCAAARGTKKILLTQLSTIKLCEVREKPREILKSFQEKVLKIHARNQGIDCRWQMHIPTDWQWRIWFDSGCGAVLGRAERGSGWG